MEKFKDLKLINQTLDKGETTCLDSETGYRYSLCAICTNDGNECSISSFERSIGEGLKITGVSFSCPICDTKLDAKPEDMFLR